MGYSRQDAAFLTDKNQFFTQLKTNNVCMLGSKKDYKFLLENQITIEAEFVQMFAVLQKQRDENNEAFWLYCYYCATMLESFYKAYSQKSKENDYKILKKQIRGRLTNVVAAQETEQSFIQQLQDSFLKGFQNIAKIPFHVSVLRDYVALSNLYRLYWVFNRLTITKGLALVKELQWLDKLDALLGTHTDVDKITSIFQAPNGVLNYFSVGLFLGRFIIDAGLLVRHTFFPSEAEKKANTSAYDRFKYELYKRHCNFTNDLVWSTVNFLTNFNDITHIPGPVAGAITAVFLGFDTCMLLYKAHLARQEYLVKKAQYEQQIRNYRNPELFNNLSGAERLKHISMLKAQCQELEIDVQTKTATFYFAASAAALLMVGFSATLIFSPAWVGVVGFFACHLAIAMYLSTGAYAKYQEKSLRLEQPGLAGQDLVVRKEFEMARNDFIYAMAKNTIAPLVLITTFAICWPAAIALTVLYVGHELLHSYSKHNEQQDVRRLALAPPQEVEEEENADGLCCVM